MGAAGNKREMPSLSPSIKQCVHLASELVVVGLHSSNVGGHKNRLYSTSIRGVAVAGFFAGMLMHCSFGRRAGVLLRFPWARCA